MLRLKNVYRSKDAKDRERLREILVGYIKNQMAQDKGK